MKKAIFIFFISLTFLISAQESKLVVYDGGENSKGKAWADPKETVTIKQSKKSPYKNSQHLILKGSWSNWWAGGGWNWYGWYNGSDNLLDYKTLNFALKLESGDRHIKDIWVSLVDTKGNHSAKVYIIKNGYASKKDLKGDYTEIALPMSKLAGIAGNTNIRAIWEIVFGIIPSAKKGSAEIFIDNIYFEK